MCCYHPSDRLPAGWRLRGLRAGVGCILRRRGWHINAQGGRIQVRAANHVSVRRVRHAAETHPALETLGVF